MSLRIKRSLKSFFEVKLANKKEGTRTAYQYAFKDFEKFCLKLDPPRKMEQIVEEMKIADIEEVIDTDLTRQNDYDFINKTFLNKEIMLQAIDTEAERYTKALTEGTLNYAKGDEYEYWKGRIDSIPIYVSWVKEM